VVPITVASRLVGSTTSRARRSAAMAEERRMTAAGVAARVLAGERGDSCVVR
jgi:hypothetical protein